MSRRQTVPEQWLIIDREPTKEVWMALEQLRRRSGVVLLVHLATPDRRRLRHLARLRDLEIRTAERIARVHNLRELRQALLRRRPVLISPIYRTRSHPEWQPLPRMRAAALARLTGRNAIALGGMDERRYAKIAPLGFIGWAGISAFRI